MTKANPILVDVDGYEPRYDEFKAWAAAAAPLFLDAHLIPGSKDFLTTISLKIRYLGTKIMLHCKLSRCKERREHPAAAKIISTSCSQILRLSWKMLEDERFVRGYVCDVVVIPIVFLVVTMAPMPDMQKEAVEILKLMRPRREGIWDSTVVVEMVEKILTPEGQNALKKLRKKYVSSSQAQEN